MKFGFCIWYRDLLYRIVQFHVSSVNGFNRCWCVL